MATCLTIVLVEDNDDLRELMAEVLRAQGHRVIALDCAEAIEDEARGERPDVFLLDLNLPGQNGYELAQRLRAAHPLVGIIIVSARAKLDDKLRAYECGADWYLNKPVAMEELSAALQSFARRQQAGRKEAEAGSMQLVQHTLQGPAASVKLTAAEAVLLTAFARAPSGRLENWQLAELLGVDTCDFNKASLEVRIVRLRKKLQQAGAPANVIEALRSVGYQLQFPVSILQ